MVVGARPNFMKMAPLYNEFKKRNMEQILIHTGQHYDENMSKVFFTDLGIPKPDINFNIGSGSHTYQTANVMLKFEDFCINNSPSLVIVFGDVNSTVACSLVCAKMGIKIIHVESGLRSFDREMPEEINRIITDHLSDILFTHSAEANENLINEGISEKNIHFVGNIMIDTLMNNLEKAKETDILNTLKIKKNGYALLTLHRPSNVDAENQIQNILETISKVANNLDFIFPIHPRTKNIINKISHKIQISDNIKFCDPLGYLDFINLMNNSKFVLTDSGGIQEETTALGVPCLTLRENTERPVTIKHGTNVLVSLEDGNLAKNIDKIILNDWKSGKIPELWDGKTAIRMTDIIQSMKLSNNAQ